MNFKDFSNPIAASNQYKSHQTWLVNPQLFGEKSIGISMTFFLMDHPEKRIPTAR